jgi:hypothetical protein
MGSLITGIFFLIVAGGVFFARKSVTSKPGQIAAVAGGGLALFPGVILVVASCVATVGTQDVGLAASA